ncbi:hypothetical protein E2C01_092721 [Portunus trituberculatus]|uniref:Uncharacterized protein n=1 Tax=Portunus trituberculatus TaxID=210409 RepID=A0A5B7JSX9_PORTR|nr:hypothetical protein [Portunus trituberculatus]
MAGATLKAPLPSMAWRRGYRGGRRNQDACHYIKDCWPPSGPVQGLKHCQQATARPSALVHVGTCRRAANATSLLLRPHPVRHATRRDGDVAFTQHPSTPAPQGRLFHRGRAEGFAPRPHVLAGRMKEAVRLLLP